MRKFSIPFNGTEPDEYLASIEKYKEYIDHIFLLFHLRIIYHSLYILIDMFMMIM